MDIGGLYGIWDMGYGIWNMEYGYGMLHLISHSRRVNDRETVPFL